MTKPVGYFVSGNAVDLLIGMYGDHLQKLKLRERIHLLFLLAEQLESIADELDSETGIASAAFNLIEQCAADSFDTSLGLLEAVVSQLRYPVVVATPDQAAQQQPQHSNEKAIDSTADRP